ncbi:DUF6383 domain-containing protein [Parabacteroides distasonis]|uniref:DUF6383 domain-containing protein n=1 Tax=Parabacteroides distasonis TaxID=823 RepID=UPI00189E539A|nr:DUF6383 domain-containing protein [Parabacteroides distasonis]MDB9152357.1 DUF6383 domain-containing protein [Parabacteroides distasonis]MDB9158031.1 DUF6383 domain-containing protein [Parabacteroides distasonis]MDB9165947.1 DUF6383 domain-containing protein [Parabacteroides distasonis]MDB9171309.1 DUF6383 domain-containing protein [Parabacteroides distasonis]MDB9196430.1 DUF6383 domain-containing protein [Parabacteroides distasonis]
MNKKFTTFLASAMLVSAFSVGSVAAYVGAVAPAEDVVTSTTPATVEGKDLAKDQTVLFMSSSDFLAVGNEKADFGKFVTVKGSVSDFKLTDLNQAMWTVSAKKNNLGVDVFSFVNKATGLSFAVDPSMAVASDKKSEAKEVTLGGSATEWVVKDGTLVSYVDGKKFVYLAKEGEGSNAKIVLVKAETVGDDKVSISFNKDQIPTAMQLHAEDLNKLLQSVSTESYFGLSMNPEVSKGNTNHLTATALKAVDVKEKASVTATEATVTEYVQLQVKDKKIDKEAAYVVVDTAYYEATEDAKMLKFTYDKISDKRQEGSYQFKFTYNAQKNELYTQVRKVVYKLEAISGKATDYAKDIKEKNNNSWWTVKSSFTSGNGATELSVAEDKYIYMANLAGNKVLTVNTDATDEKCYDNRTQTSDGTLKSDVDITNDLQRTKITLGTNFTGLVPTTLADGVYMIQFKAGGSDRDELKGTYALANLAGNFGWAKQAERQDFNHMPAAQWVVTKNGISSTSSISIQNREFNDKAESGVYPTVKIPTNVQLYAVKDSKDVFFYTTNGDNESVADTVSFVAINDAKDLKIGYRYVPEDSAMVQTYVFNYLHGLALDKYLYTPAGKDSIVRVNENGDKTNFRLVVVAKDDNYGVGDSLVRNVYQIKNGDSYLTYDSKAKKYVLGSTPTNFFLKENNCIDGKHYYALVEAVVRKYKITEGDKIYSPAYNGFKSADKVVVDGKEVTVPTLENGEETLLFDADGNYLVKDNSVIKKAYVYKANDDKKIVLTEIELDAATTPQKDKSYYDSSAAQNGLKASVDDNTLDLTQGSTNDKFETGSNREIRTSAFAVVTDDSPLYRRFNNVELKENETADSLFFVEKIRKEYLMDEWNKNLTDKAVDYVGIWNKEKADGKLAFIVDTAWVNRGAGTIKPQYLVSVARDDQEGTPGIPCTYEHNHFDNAGNPVNAANCSHATKAHPGFHYGKYMVSFADSALIKGKEYKTPYMDIDGGYTRVGFVKAIHYGDSLYVLTNGFEKMAPSELDVETIIANYKKADLENFIVNLQGDNHKNVTWSFRYVNPDKAGAVAEEGEANEFLFESNIYNENGSASTGKATKGFDKAVAGSIAPQYAAWLKMQNGCLVLTRGDSEFNAAKTGSDGALIFNAYQKTDAEDMVTSIEGANAEGVSIVAGNGTVTVQGAAGKSIVITNILGKVVAETVLTSDNATIAVPAGIVAVAVDGEEAVKAIVK